MVSVGMGNKSAIHRHPRVDVEVAGFAVQAAVSDCEEVGGRHFLIAEALRRYAEG